MNADQINERLREVELQLTKLVNKPVRIVWDHPWHDPGSIMLHTHFSGLTIKTTYPLTNFMTKSTSTISMNLLHRWLTGEAAAS